MKWDPALWKPIVATAVSLTAFILVTVFAWKSNIASIKSLFAWFRSLPRRLGQWSVSRKERRRARNDPAFRRCLEAVNDYNGVLFWAIQSRNALALADNDLAQAMETDGVGVGRLTAEREAALDQVDALRKAAAAMISGLTDEQIGFIAGHLHAELFDGLIPAGEIGDFLAEERALVAASPSLVVGHEIRLIRRFGQRYHALNGDPESSPDALDNGRS